MKEGSLVAFTILSQMAAGAFWSWGALSWLEGGAAQFAWLEVSIDVLTAIVLVMMLALSASFFHLGSPARAWRACCNLRSSWLSREILFAALFLGVCVLLCGMLWFGFGTQSLRKILVWGCAFMGLGLLVSMVMAYRLRTIPAWNSWITWVSFFTTALLLGGLGVGVLLVLNTGASVGTLQLGQHWIGKSAVALLAVQLVAIPLWLARLAAGSEAAASAYISVTRERGYVYKLRLVLVIVGIMLLVIFLAGWTRSIDEPVFILIFGVVSASEVLGRLLFYQARQRHGV